MGTHSPYQAIVVTETCDNNRMDQIRELMAAKDITSFQLVVIPGVFTRSNAESKQHLLECVTLLDEKVVLDVGLTKVILLVFPDDTSPLLNSHLMATQRKLEVHPISNSTDLPDVEIVFAEAVLGQLAEPV